MARISISRSSIVTSPNIASPVVTQPALKTAEAAPAQSSFMSTLMAAALVPPSYTTIQLSNSSTIGDNYTHTADGSFRIQGLNGNDVITVAAGTTGNDFLEGGAGNDILNAAGTDDILDGGAGNDTLNGNDGNDILRGGAGADLLNGGAGIDTADYSASAAAVTISLPLDPTRTARGIGGDANLDTLSSIENVIGSAGADRITGNELDNQFVGNAGNDILRGMDGNDVLIGDAMIDVDQNGVPDDENGDGIPDGVNEAQTGGDDFLDGGFGNDQLYGGGGDDTLSGSFGDDIMYGGYGNDTLTGSDGDDFMDGGEGDDFLTGSLGNDTLIGGGGNDFLSASIGNDTLDGGDGDDELQAGAGDDIVNGGAGNDMLFGGGGDGDPLNGGDILNGGDGDDTLVGGAEPDQMDGGAGNDTADYSAAGGPVGIDLGAIGTAGTSGAAAGDTLVNIENVVGSAFDDILVGDGNDNSFTGGAGADLIVGQSGFDTSDYSTSAAAVTARLNGAVVDPAVALVSSGGDAEGDTLLAIERLIGSAFADTLIGDELSNTFMGGAGADVIDGGLGTDTAEYSSSAAAVSITLDETGAALGVGGDAEGDTLTSIENLIGSANNDTLIGNGLTNRIDGGAGDDFIRGGAGGSSAGPILEILIGGAGVDTADYSTSTAGVNALLSDSLTSGFLSTGGDADGDVLVTMENIIGSAFADSLIGASGANRLEGGDGNDLLRGNGGADVLIGGNGVDTASYSTSTAAVSVTLADVGFGTGVGGDAQGDLLSTIENLIGSAFNDILFGNSAANRLDGGAGNDTFRSGTGGSAAGGIVEAIIGGDGVDTIDYSQSTGAVLARLFSGTAGVTLSQGGHADGDALAQMENAIGSAFNDILFGTELVNRLDGGAGNDTLAGLDGADVLIGGLGTDTADYSASTAGVQVAISTTATTTGAGGHAAGDLLSGIESLTGSNGSDILIGSAAANKLISGSGNDQMRGGSGADILSATGTGQKLMWGDQLTTPDGGAAGADLFRILGGTSNVIADYQAGEDVVLRSLPAAGTAAQATVTFGGVAYRAALVTGVDGAATHSTFVLLGTTAAMDAAQATAAFNTFVANDLFFDPALIA